MFWGIVSSVLSVFNTFAYQRAIFSWVELGAKPVFRTFFNNFVVILLLAVLWAIAYPFWDFVSLDLSPYFADWKLFALAASASLAWIGWSLAGQYAYSNERAGVLAPYSETGRLLTIVAGFFVFTNSSVVSFASAIVAVLAIIGFSVDFRSFSVNRYCAVLAASGVLRAFSSIAIGFVVVKVAPFAITLFDVAFAAIVTLAAVHWKKALPDVRDKRKFMELAKWTAVNDAVWIVTFVISLLLLKDIGLVAVSLLWMLTLVLTIAYDSYRAKKFPETKIVLLAATVATCVTVGSVFR